MSDNEQHQALVAAMATAQANDSCDVWERLTVFAQRGIDAPEALAPHEIQQVCFALSVLIAIHKKE